MKKSFFIVLSLLAVNAWAQITITESDISVDPVTFKLIQASSDSFETPKEGSDMIWDFRYLNAVGTDSFEFKEANNTEFLLSDLVRENVFEDVVQGMGFYCDEYFIENNDFFGKSGFHINERGYDLSSYTFTAGDSLFFPEADYIYEEPVALINYPLTSTSSWTSNYVEKGDLVVTVKYYSLDHSKGERVRHVYCDYEVVGWGDLILPYDSAFSQAYEVLMLKSQILKTDSFFLDGAPASALLLNTFGLSQGNQIIENNYVFLRKGKFQPILDIGFGVNNFEYPEYINIDAELEMTSIPDLSPNLWSVYPDPVLNELNIVNAKDSEVSVFNIQGKRVYTHKLQSLHEVIDFSGFERGTYIVRLQSGRVIKTVKIVKPQ